MEEGRRERDLVIREAFERRASVSELAQAAGVSRQTIYAILERISDER